MFPRHSSHASRPEAGWVKMLLLCGWMASASASPLGNDAPLLNGPYDMRAAIGQSRWSWGVVSEPRVLAPWAYGQDPHTASATNLMVGMNLGSSSNARLVWYAPLTQQRLNTLAADHLQTGGALDPNGVPLPTPLRVGLVLTPSDPWADLRQGSLTKLELSGHMALSLRSKGGGVWLALSGRW
ncbi:MAG TPA: hypothetical protein VGQ91_10145 [Ideonella sp.]|jgi:hypothetical protein|nr:hypothetical protein [Ideonella sp.]